MTRRVQPVAAGDTARISQYNNLVKEAFLSDWLLAHEQSSPDLTLYVDPGVAYINGIRVDFAGGNSPSFTAPSTNPRIDVLSLNASGVLVRTAGAESASPVAPTVPDNSFPICQVYNKVSQTQLVDVDASGKGYVYKDTRAALSFNDVNYAVDSVGTDAYAITLSPAPIAYKAGQRFSFKVGTVNTGPATLNVNGLGAKTIKKNVTGDLDTGDILVNQIVDVMYDGTNMQMLSQVAKNEGILNFTAEEDITVGMPVGASFTKNNYVAKASKGYTTPVTHGISSPIGDIGKHFLSAPIGGDKFVRLNYTAATSDTLFAQVGSINRATMALTVGTPVAVATAFAPKSSNMENICVCKLDTDKFIVFYLLDSSTTIIKYRIGTVSGTTITFGTEATAFTAATTVATSLSFVADFVSANKGIFCFKAAVTADSRLVAFTVSGTVATFGSGQVPGTLSQTNTQTTFIRTIATDKVILITANTSNSVYAQVFTLSGTTITAGTEAQISTAVGTAGTNGEHNMYVVNPASNVFVLRWQGSGVNMNLMAGTVSGTTVTTGTPLLQTGSLDDVGVGGLFAESATVLYMTGQSSRGKISKYTLSGTTLTDAGMIATNLGTSFEATQSVAEFMVPMDNGYFIMVGQSSTTMSAYIQGMTNSFIGIAQASVSRGASLPVLVRGVDANQSGLSAGALYIPNLGALQFIDMEDGVSPNNYYDYLTDIIKAISSTQVIV